MGLRSGGSSASFRRCQRKVNRAVVDAGIPLVRDGSGVVRRNLFGRPAHSVTSTQVLCGPAGWRSRMIQQDVVRASSRRDLPLKRNLLADLSAARLTRGATASGGSDHGDGSRQIRPGPAPVQPRRRCDRTTRRGRRQPRTSAGVRAASPAAVQCGGAGLRNLTATWLDCLPCKRFTTRATLPQRVVRQVQRDGTGQLGRPRGEEEPVVDHVDETFDPQESKHSVDRRSRRRLQHGQRFGRRGAVRCGRGVVGSERRVHSGKRVLVLRQLGDQGFLLVHQLPRNMRVTVSSHCGFPQEPAWALV
ncbi:hypothetical protein SAMN05421507_1157 [Lentzea jiangxiensis]|uniref:Uncharacterized protein n=1 Tax=Lentzea jiangxiensis TaxID=641025 RepID=A0A1H0VMX0_9PSEU|nr:hypothetical protein SAMN05421507_1157 [Lentzea jiangxiensis]